MGHMGHSLLVNLCIVTMQRSCTQTSPDDSGWTCRKYAIWSSMRLVVSMQALLCFGSRNKSTCPLSYLSNIFVCILSLLLIHSVAVNNLSASLVPQFSLGSFSPASIPKFCHMFLEQRAWQRTCFGWILENHRCISCRCNRLGKRNQRWSHRCGMSFVPWHGNCSFHFRISDDIRIRYQMISEYHILSISSFWPWMSENWGTFRWYLLLFCHEHHRRFMKGKSEWPSSCSQDIIYPALVGKAQWLVGWLVLVDSSAEFRKSIQIRSN